MSNRSLPRIFDAQPDVKTYLFERGDYRQPVEDAPLKPGVPDFFKFDIKPKPVSLPAEAYYPGLKSYVQRDTLAEGEKTIARLEGERPRLEGERPRLEAIRAKSEKVLAELKAGSPKLSDKSQGLKIEEAKIKLLKSRQSVELNEQQTINARLQLDAVQACIAADKVKYASDKSQNPELLRETAIAANRAASEFAVGSAEGAVLIAEHRLQEELASGKNDQVRLKLRRGTLKREKDKLAKAQTTLQKALGPKASTEYEPFVPVHPRQSTGRRLSLARWITDRNNPLTARVAINHIWARHFGRPIVPSVFDFGMAGKRPSHPALLDWLAVELMEAGWSMKHVHRLIVTSRTYRSSSSRRDAAETNLKRDPDNHYLWKMNTRRMEAEIVRDSMLYLAGRLDPSHGGPEIATKDSSKILRRSVYFLHTGEDRLAMSELFDGADVNECYSREETISPQQALALTNGPISLKQSCLIALELSNAEEANEGFIAAAFAQVLSREPKKSELEACVRFLEDQESLFGDVKKLTPFQAGSLGINPSKDAKVRARENLIQILFNHNDFVTIR